MYIDYFNENLDLLHKNIDNLKPHLSTNLESQLTHQLTNKILKEDELLKLNFDTELDKIVFDKGFEYGIKGRSDILDIDQKSLIEIKTSHKTTLSREWIIQVFIYSLLKPNYINTYNINKIKIINILSGKIYSINIPTVNKREIIKTILVKYGFKNRYIDKLLNNLV